MKRQAVSFYKTNTVDQSFYCTMDLSVRNVIASIPGAIFLPRKTNTMIKKIQTLAPNTTLSKIYADLYRTCRIY